MRVSRVCIFLFNDVHVSVALLKYIKLCVNMKVHKTTHMQVHNSIDSVVLQSLLNFFYSQASWKCNLTTHLIFIPNMLETISFPKKANVVQFAIIFNRVMYCIYTCLYCVFSGRHVQCDTYANQMTVLLVCHCFLHYLR